MPTSDDLLPRFASTPATSRVAEWPTPRCAPLLDDLAAPDPLTRSQVASAMRGVAEKFAGVPDGRDTVCG